MNWDETYIKFEDVEPEQLRRVKKSIFDYGSGEFQEKIFCSVLLSHHSKTIEWLTKNYGASSYQRGLWWTTWDRLVMEESIYIFYLLSKSND